jgi:hypothetical protein
MTDQAVNFVPRLWARENRTALNDVISKSLVFFSNGSSDLFEYVDIQQAPNRNGPEFLQLLVASYSHYLKVDHQTPRYYPSQENSDTYYWSCSAVLSEEARRAEPVPGGVLPVGVIAQATMDVDQYGCLGAANNPSRQLHPMIASMLHDLSAEISRMNYSLVDTIKMAEFIFNNNSTPNYSNPPISSVLETLRAEDPKKVIDFFLSADFTVLRHGVLRVGAVWRGRLRLLGSSVPEPRQPPLLGRSPSVQRRDHRLT